MPISLALSASNDVIVSNDQKNQAKKQNKTKYQETNEGS
jgi:hypothetical protein